LIFCETSAFSRSFQWTCRDRIEEMSRKDRIINNPSFISTMGLLLSITPQLMSIICFLILLILYLKIEELKKTIYGKCWINFIINSLINYLGTIAVLIITHLLLNDLVSKNIIGLLLWPIAIIVLLTEFSLYFWLNITFFEAFYIIR
jgi:hypothetical protein